MQFHRLPFEKPHLSYPTPTPPRSARPITQIVNIPLQYATNLQLRAQQIKRGMMRRLLAVSAAFSAPIPLAIALLLLRGFFATDIWYSHRYTPATRTLESRSIENSNGYFYMVHSATLFPQGSPPPLLYRPDGSWAHEAQPANLPLNFPRPAWGTVLFSHTANTTPAPASTRSFHVAMHKVSGLRLAPLM